MNVVPGRQRGFVGATLLKAQFERSAYGCKLYCCWCAQDIEANRFWESTGFVPLAYRAGSETKSHVHIFWQKRIRSGDETTPYWFPSQTSSGSIREDRLVLPIPPGMRWSDEMPRVLPQGQLPVGGGRLPVKEGKKRPPASPASARPNPSKSGDSRPASPYDTGRSKLHFAVPEPVKTPKEQAPREKRKSVKNDPKLVAAARELRDRWLERVNADPTALPSRGKYDVTKARGDVEGSKGLIARRAGDVPLLPDAIAA
jgi:hypothetical protein